MGASILALAKSIYYLFVGLQEKEVRPHIQQFTIKGKKYGISRCDIKQSFRYANLFIADVSTHRLRFYMK